MSTHNQNIVFSRNMKNIRIFYLKICHFLVVKFSVYLNKRVFVMILSQDIEQNILSNGQY